MKCDENMVQRPGQRAPDEWPSLKIEPGGAGRRPPASLQTPPPPLTTPLLHSAALPVRRRVSGGLQVDGGRERRMGRAPLLAANGNVVLVLGEGGERRRIEEMLKLNVVTRAKPDQLLLLCACMCVCV